MGLTANIWDKKDRACFSFPDSPSCFSIVYFVLLTYVFILVKNYLLPHSIRVVHNSHPYLGSQPISPLYVWKMSKYPHSDTSIKSNRITTITNTIQEYNAILNFLFFVVYEYD